MIASESSLERSERVLEHRSGFVRTPEAEEHDAEVRARRCGVLVIRGKCLLAYRQGALQHGGRAVQIHVHVCDAEVVQGFGDVGMAGIQAASRIPSTRRCVAIASSTWPDSR